LGGRARTELVPAAPATVPRYRADQCCAGATTGGPAAEPAIGRSGTQSWTSSLRARISGG